MLEYNIDLTGKTILVTGAAGFKQGFICYLQEQRFTLRGRHEPHLAGCLRFRQHPQIERGGDQGKDRFARVHPERTQRNR